jgi:hypothetical protein
MASMQNMPWTSQLTLVSLDVLGGRFCGLATNEDLEGGLRVRSLIRRQQPHYVDGQGLRLRFLVGWLS